MSCNSDCKGDSLGEYLGVFFLLGAVFVWILGCCVGAE